MNKTREEREQRLFELVNYVELDGLDEDSLPEERISKRVKEEISKMTDEELDEEIEFYDYISGK